VIVYDGWAGVVWSGSGPVAGLCGDWGWRLVPVGDRSGWVGCDPSWLGCDLVDFGHFLRKCPIFVRTARTSCLFFYM
jgi:hypothetical protein